MAFDIVDVYNDIKDWTESWGNPFTSIAEGDYSDYTSNMNVKTDGWYSTIMDSVPFIRSAHSALLDREKTKDYLDNSGLSWSDVIGYNTSKLTGSTSSDLAAMFNQGTSYLGNISSDLGKLYSGQKK